jgi:hypothetical protein
LETVSLAEAGFSAGMTGRLSGRTAHAMSTLEVLQQAVLGWEFGIVGERLSHLQIAEELGASPRAVEEFSAQALRALYRPSCN